MTLRTEQGHEIHRWEQGDQRWACGAYDHGPMCRLCQREDLTLGALLNQAEEGNLSCIIDANGGFRFAVTPKGTAEIDQMLAGDPEMKAFYEDYKRGRGRVVATEKRLRQAIADAVSTMMIPWLREKRPAYSYYEEEVAPLALNAIPDGWAKVEGRWVRVSPTLESAPNTLVRYQTEWLDRRDG